MFTENQLTPYHTMIHFKNKLNSKITHSKNKLREGFRWKINIFFCNLLLWFLYIFFLTHFVYGKFLDRKSYMLVVFRGFIMGGNNVFSFFMNCLEGFFLWEKDGTRLSEEQTNTYKIKTSKSLARLNFILL